MPESEAQQRAAEALELDAKAITGNQWEAEPHCHTRKGCTCGSCDVLIGWKVDPGGALGLDQSCEMITVDDEETIDRCEEDVMDWNDANLIARYRTLCPELARDVQRLEEEKKQIRAFLWLEYGSPPDHLLGNAMGTYELLSEDERREFDKAMEEVRD